MKISNRSVTIHGVGYNFWWPEENDPIQSFHMDADGCLYANECLSLDIEPSPHGVHSVPSDSNTKWIGVHIEPHGIVRAEDTDLKEL